MRTRSEAGPGHCGVRPRPPPPASHTRSECSALLPAPVAPCGCKAHHSREQLAGRCGVAGRRCGAELESTPQLLVAMHSREARCSSWVGECGLQAWAGGVQGCGLPPSQPRLPRWAQAVGRGRCSCCRG